MFQELIDLWKAKSHKYTHKKRVYIKGKPSWRYYYKEHHGGGVTKVDELHVGEAFKVNYKGKEGHFHITKIDGDKVKVVHDETGKETTLTRAELKAVLKSTHTQALKENVKQKEQSLKDAKSKLHKINAKRRLEQAKKQLGEEAPTEEKKQESKSINQELTAKLVKEIVKVNKQGEVYAIQRPKPTTHKEKVRFIENKNFWNEQNLNFRLAKYAEQVASAYGVESKSTLFLDDFLKDAITRPRGDDEWKRPTPEELTEDLIKEITGLEQPKKQLGEEAPMEEEKQKPAEEKDNLAGTKRMTAEEFNSLKQGDRIRIKHKRNDETQPRTVEYEVGRRSYNKTHQTETKRLFFVKDGEADKGTFKKMTISYVDGTRKGQGKYVKMTEDGRIMHRVLNYDISDQKKKIKNDAPEKEEKSDNPNAVKHSVVLRDRRGKLHRVQGERLIEKYERGGNWHMRLNVELPPDKDHPIPFYRDDPRNLDVLQGNTESSKNKKDHNWIKKQKPLYVRENKDGSFDIVTKDTI